MRRDVDDEVAWLAFEQHGVFARWQVLAAGGYGVLFINPRGSTSYGQKFVNAVRCDYGGNDFADLMDAVDHALTFGVPAPWAQPEIVSQTIKGDLLTIKGDIYVVKDIFGRLVFLRIDKNTKRERLLVPGEKIEAEVIPGVRVVALKPAQ